MKHTSRAEPARPAGWLALMIAASAACGGTGTRATPQPDASVPPFPTPVDPGSGPVDCTVTNGYQMTMIDDFEFGAATGWYTNNEVCYPWTQAMTECADAGVVCYQPSLTMDVEACQPDGAATGLPPIYNACLGGFPFNCNAPHAFDACQQACLAIQPMPPFLADQLPASIIPNGGRCGSHYALNIQGGPFSNWGGNVGKRFAVPFDASSFDGIAVWVRTAPGYTNDPRLTLSDMFTDSQYNMYPPPGVTAYCNPNPSCAAQAAQGNMNCYNIGCDPFGQYMPAIEDWRLFILSFADMRQGGWGKQRPSLDLTQLYSLQISYPVGTWDLWIDDVAFYRVISP